MIEKVAWIEAIIQRPAMRWRSSSSASRRLSWLKLSVSSLLLPIVLPSRTPETESDSSTSDEMSASDPCLVDAISRRTRPILRVISTKMGSSANAASASRQSSTIRATAVASTVVTFDAIEVAVVVTTVSTPPMSLAMRLCTSPVRVRVKNASDRRWRCR